MWGALREATTDPASFFDHEADDPELRGPALVVVLVAVIGLLSSVPVFRALFGTVPPGAGPFVLVGLVVGAVIGLVTPFVIWLVYALLFYGLSALFGGEGSFRDLFRLVGWGFAPSAVSALVGGLVTVWLVSGVDFSNPQQAQQFAQAMKTDPLGLFHWGVSLLTTLWSAWMWSHAVGAARGLSRRDAWVSVGVVVLAGVLVGLVSRFVV